MADAVAQEIATLAGHEADKLRKLLDLIADGKPVSLDLATNQMKAP